MPQTTLIQYCGNIARWEAVNIGVVVTDGEDLAFKMATPARSSAFWGIDTTGTIKHLGDDLATLNANDFNKWFDEQSPLSSVQLVRAGATLRPLPEAIEEAEKYYL